MGEICSTCTWRLLLVGFGLCPSPPGQVGQGHIVEPRPLETRGGGFGSSACTLAGWRALSIYFPKQYYVAMAILFPLFDRQQSAISSQHRLHAWRLANGNPRWKRKSVKEWKREGETDDGLRIILIAMMYDMMITFIKAMIMIMHDTSTDQCII